MSLFRIEFFREFEIDKRIDRVVPKVSKGDKNMMFDHTENGPVGACLKPNLSRVCSITDKDDHFRRNDNASITVSEVPGTESGAAKQASNGSAI